jgi:hypothetical protein
LFASAINLQVSPLATVYLVPKHGADELDVLAITVSIA